MLHLLFHMMFDWTYGPAMLLTLLICVPVCIVWTDGIDKMKEDKNDKT